jgi:predicted homoserine dehydrogenase-like protein
LAEKLLPIGLAHGIALKRDVPAGSLLSYNDADLDEASLAVRIRRQMEDQAPR